MIYVFDIDSTICKTIDGNYPAATPLKGRIKRVNKLFDQGNKIIFSTARGFGSGIDWLNFTGKQLEEWGVKFHELYIGKPFGDLYIDDKGISDKDFFK